MALPEQVSPGHTISSKRIEINPSDARARRIADGDWVRVASRRGAIEARARLIDRSAPGLVFATFHYKEAPINQITNDAHDPVGKTPEFKVAAVRVDKVDVDKIQNGG